MKSVLCYLIGVLPLLAANSKVPLDADDLARRKAYQIVQQGDLDGAVVYLAGNLRGAANAEATANVVTQSLVEIAWSFYNRHQIVSASNVAREAIHQAAPLLKGTRADVPLSELYIQLGQLSEHLLFDLPAAHAYYQAAVGIDSRNSRAKAYLRYVQDKQDKAQRAKATNHP